MTTTDHRNSLIARLAQAFAITYSEARAELEAEGWSYEHAAANLAHEQARAALAQIPVINQ